MLAKLLWAALLLAPLALAAPASAELTSIQLPQPNLNASGKTVLQALNSRKSDRDFAADKDLSPQQLSEVLWAAGGINRPELPDGTVGRTAPSSHNLQPMDIFAVTRDGAYKYDPRAHALNPVTEGDLRSSAGLQTYVASAPLNLIYVADLNKLHGEDEVEKRLDAHLDVGFIAENVYLYCAAAGLNVIARTSIDPEALIPLLKLEEGFLPLMGQTVGYPTK